jgi:hypothetical protein
MEMRASYFRARRASASKKLARWFDAQRIEMAASDASATGRLEYNSRETSELLAPLGFYLLTQPSQERISR